MPSNSTTSRIVFQGSPNSIAQLEKMAETLDLSKVKVLQLAVSVLAKISDKISQGATVIVREENGKETEVWLPQVGPGQVRPSSSPRSSVAD
ncbi:MAG TPA: hypothetical protein VHD56_06655 [Tepidisphaeraceae bacterium]|nr:hypothetical protein [Tepidisphaeraceae bacterium]